LLEFYCHLPHSELRPQRRVNMWILRILATEHP
jgi:hypothetical protein